MVPKHLKQAPFARIFYRLAIDLPTFLWQIIFAVNMANVKSTGK